MGARDSQTLTIDDFGNGIDRRLGILSRVVDKFYSLSNYLISSGRKLTRRPPMRNLAGSLDPATQGRRYLNGKMVTIAPYGTTVAHSIAGVPVDTLYFDLPHNALTGPDDWQLVDMQLFNEQLFAVVRHHFDSDAAPWRLFAHVWDDKRPTFVQDPAIPSFWGPSLPLHAYGAGKLGAYVDFIPRLAISADRVYLSRADGNVAFCGAGSPRIWNTRTPAEFLGDGRWWYWLTTNQAGNQSIILDVSYPDLVRDGAYAAYVLEVCRSDGSWKEIREQASISVSSDYTIANVQNPWDATKRATRITYQVPGDGRVMRFRALAKPAVVVQAGLYFVPDGTVVGGILAHDGNGEQVESFTVTGPWVASTPYILSVPASNAPIPVPTIAPASPGSMPFNGQERYWLRILASASTDVAGTAFDYRLTDGAGGLPTSITTTVGGTRVVGVGTKFLAELEVGRQVEINGERRVVRYIGSDEIIEVDAPFSSVYTGPIGLRDPRYRYAYEIGDAGNAWYAAREAEATFELAGKDDAGYLGTAMYDSSGERPLAIATLQNRLLVQFKSAMQAWGVGANVLTDMRLLSVDGQDAGINTNPTPVLVNGMTMLPTVNGPRAFDPSGNNKDYVDFIGTGDLLRGIKLPDLTKAVWWPTFRAYITCGSPTDGDTTFYVLFHHKDTKVLAWATWTFAGINAVDGFFLYQNDLMIVQGNSVYRVAAEDTNFRDDNDAPGEPAYESRARWIYCTLGRPEKNKRLTRCEIIQTGTCALNVYMNPYAVAEVTPGPPSVSGITAGRQRVPLMVMGPGIGLELVSTDATGHELDSVGFEYLLLNR